jgi:hypothetical protein
MPTHHYLKSRQLGVEVPPVQLNQMLNDVASSSMATTAAVSDDVPNVRVTTGRCDSF